MTVLKAPLYPKFLPIFFLALGNQKIMLSAQCESHTAGIFKYVQFPQEKMLWWTHSLMVLHQFKFMRLHEHYTTNYRYICLQTFTFKQMECIKKSHPCKTNFCFITHHLLNISQQKIRLEFGNMPHLTLNGTLHNKAFYLSK